MSLLSDTALEALITGKKTWPDEFNEKFVAWWLRVNEPAPDETSLLRAFYTAVRECQAANQCALACILIASGQVAANGASDETEDLFYKLLNLPTSDQLFSVFYIDWRLDQDQPPSAERPNPDE